MPTQESRMRISTVDGQVLASAGCRYLRARLLITAVHSCRGEALEASIGRDLAIFATGCSPRTALRMVLAERLDELRRRRRADGRAVESLLQASDDRCTRG